MEESIMRLRKGTQVVSVSFLSAKCMDNYFELEMHFSNYLQLLKNALNIIVK